MINIASEPIFAIARFHRMTAFLAALAMVLIAGTADAAKRVPEAEEFVQGLIDEGLAVLRDENVSLEQKKEFFGDLVLTNADIPYMANFALGRYRRKLDAEQHSEYMSLFEQYTKNFYETRLGEYGGQDIRVISSVDLDKKGIIVKSEMAFGESILDLEWLVAEKDGGAGYSIVDIGVAGIFMVFEQRDQFTTVIGNNGGNPEALLVKLRDMVSSGESAELPPPTN